MCGLRLPCVLVMTALVIPGCDLSTRDQVLLIHLSETVPTPGVATIVGLRELRVECSTLGSLSIVRAPGAKFFYVLDPRRTLQRWEYTGAALTGDVLVGLRGYLSLYRSSMLQSLWDNYGRGAFDEKELQTLAGRLELVWKPMRLISGTEYETALSLKLSPEAANFLQLLCHEQVALYLAVNEYRGAEILEEKYDAFGSYSTDLVVNVRIKRGQKVEGLRFSIPINPIMCPYVGHAHLRSPIRPLR